MPVPNRSCLGTLPATVDRFPVHLHRVVFPSPRHPSHPRPCRPGETAFRNVPGLSDRRGGDKSSNDVLHGVARRRWSACGLMGRGPVAQWLVRLVYFPFSTGQAVMQRSFSWCMLAQTCLRKQESPFDESVKLLRAPPLHQHDCTTRKTLVQN